MSTQSEDSPILAFYRMTGLDAAGRSLSDIMAFGDRELEAIHNYIQWLFPLAEESGANSRAPLLTATDMAAFREDPALRERMIRSLVMMLEFYGLALSGHDGVPAVRVSSLFVQRKTAWLRVDNHNLLRITRILRSLTLLGLPEYAGALFACLERLYSVYGDTIGQRTLNFWREAVHDRGVTDNGATAGGSREP